MKKALKILSLILVGCIIGFVLASLNSFRTISHQNSIALLEMAADVYQLQEGQSEAVLERKLNALPTLVQQLDQHHRKFISQEQWTSTMWAVSRCYEDQEPGPPPSIKPLLDELPPRPLTCCEIRRQQEAQQQTQESASDPCQGCVP
ncbi:MAG: hypothetical protein JW936_11170 [Sedimentisphaerales bacterium]|nr:hypothetical protein [Sedimentisphaerales bacterium]